MYPHPVTGGSLSLCQVEVLRALPPHPHIVSLLEVVSTPTTVVLALELIAGGDLLSPIERHGAYKEGHARRLFSQVCLMSVSVLTLMSVSVLTYLKERLKERLNERLNERLGGRGRDDTKGDA